MQERTLKKRGNDVQYEGKSGTAGLIKHVIFSSTGWWRRMGKMHDDGRENRHQENVNRIFIIELQKKKTELMIYCAGLRA